MSDQPLPPYDAIPAAWASLPPETQAELGCMLLEWVLAAFVEGEAFADVDKYCNEAIRDTACDRQRELFSKFESKVWALFPELFGPEGGDPPWAWRSPDELINLLAAKEAEVLELREAVAERLRQNTRADPSTSGAR